MTFRNINFSATFLVILILTGCKSPSPSTESKSVTSSKTFQNMTDAQNSFSFSLFEKSLQSEAEKSNVFISPPSIFMDFAMLYNGASGRTKTAMENALHINGFSLEILNASQSELMENLPKLDSGVTINMANAIWYSEDKTPKSSFLSVNQNFYKAKIQKANFRNPQTKTDINDWVSKNTNGKIPSIIDNISPGEIMFLLNAVYFKGQWKNEFNPKLTQNQTFHSKTKDIETPFMYKDKRQNYLKNEDLQIVELPYGEGNFSMYVLLPSEGNSVDELAKKLNPKYFSELMTDMTSTSVELFLPKWESSFSAESLKESLTAMGMGIAFENKAEFPNVFEDESTKISQIKHKTYIKVDEEGTEAAAATSIGMVTTSMPLPTEEKMNVNRPFVYLITENKSGTILFLGAVGNPAE